MAQPSNWGRFLAAIRAQESGGNYSEDTAGCLGAYCWNAQGNWDTMASAAGEGHYVGVNPSQVPAAVQDKVASTNLYRIYQQSGGGTGGLAAAARWWNGGTTQSVPNPGLPAQPWAKSCGGGSSGAYACQVLARMGLGGHFLAGGGTGGTQQGGSGAGGTVTLTAAQMADCALGISNVNPIPSWVPFVGSPISACLLTKPEVRAIAAVANLVAGTVLMGVGLGLMTAFTGPGRQILAVVTSVAPGGKAVKAAGAAVPAQQPAAQQAQAAAVAS